MGAHGHDIAVLGGGIIGCAVAEELARRGRRVVVIERQQIGAEASSAAAGIISAQTDLREPGPFFDLCQAARQMYPRWIEHLQRRSGLSLGYHVDGLLYLTASGREEQALDRQARWQARAGVRVERWSRKEVRRREPSVDGRIRSGFYFPTEAQVDNVQLMRALAKACAKADVELLERTTARRLLARGGAVEGVDTDRGNLLAPVVVSCLGAWAGARHLGLEALPIEPVRGQMMAFRAPARLFRHIVWAESGSYVVQRRDNRLIVGSTLEWAGFDKSLTLDGMHQILSGLRQISSALRACTFLEAWSGLRPCVKDRLPVIGETPLSGFYLATGHFRHGILLAPITATLLAERILRGRSSLDLSPFALERFPASLRA